MKKVFFFILVNLLFSSILFGQLNRSKVWVTGLNGSNVLFNSTQIDSKFGQFTSKYFYTGNSNICDTNGHLILASDGFNVYDSLGNYLDGGDTLVPLDFYNYHNGFSIESQSSIFLPMDSNKYYFITATFSDGRLANCFANNDCHFDMLLYNVIDMNANAGAGKVVKRMVPVLENANLRKTQMMACRHGNGKDWWLLKNEGDSGNVHTFLFTQDSVYDKGVQVFSEPVWGIWDIRGMSTFNSDGSMFATTSHGSSSGYVFLADFDRCYGQLSNPYVIQMPIGSQHNPDTNWTERLSVGLAFSPNNQFLYVISMSNIYQYDLQDSTWYHLAGLDTSYQQFQNYDATYLGPDGKIYIGNFGGLSKQMSRIDNPDIKGVGCNFCPRCLRLDSLGSQAYVGTPPCMPNYGLGAKTCWPLESQQYEVGSEQLEVYPNPTNSKLRIKNGELKMKELYNSVGQMVLSTKENVIDVSNLPTGIYYLRVENQVVKVVVE